MSKLLRFQPRLLCMMRCMSTEFKKVPGVTYENKAYPWEGVKIEKIDYSGKYGKVPNTRIMLKQLDEMTHFCKDDGLLVWQKKGATDKVLYYIVVLGAVVIMVHYFAVLYTLEYPPCPKREFPDYLYRPEMVDDGKVWHPYGCGHKGCPPFTPPEPFIKKTWG